MALHLIKVCVSSVIFRRINIGSRFQADIPELKDTALVGKEDHKATLVWKPWPDLENKAFQQRGTDFNFNKLFLPSIAYAQQGSNVSICGLGRNGF